MVAVGILDQVKNNGKIVFLMQKRDAFTDTIPQPTLQFHSNLDDTIPLQQRSYDTIICTFQFTTTGCRLYSLEIPSAWSAWILPHKGAHADTRNVTAQWAVRLCATLKKHSAYIKLFWRLAWSEDLHDHAKELHGPEDCGQARYSRPQLLVAEPPGAGPLPGLVSAGCSSRRWPHGCGRYAWRDG